MSGLMRGEVEHMRYGRLGRLATVKASGRPHLVLVGFRYDPGLCVVDDELRGAPSAPRWARGVEVRGRAGSLDGDAGSEGEVIRNFPGRIVVRGIDARSVPG